MANEDRDLLPFWSFPVGRCLGIPVRISLLLPLLGVVLCGWFGLRMGLSLTSILLLALGVHLIGHVVAAAFTEGRLESIIFWPGGDQTPVIPGKRWGAGAWAVSGGMLANLLVCLFVGWPLLRTGRLAEAMNPFGIVNYRFGDDATENVIYLAFAVNWLLVIVNLIPVRPFDAGLGVERFMDVVFGRQSGYTISSRIGWATAVLLLVGGLYQNAPLVVALAAVAIAALVLREAPEISLENDEELFLGYDFSEGYTSLDRSMAQQSVSPPPSLLERWRMRRRQLRERREEELNREVERELDRILEKVHQTGIDSLNPHERMLLDRASQRFRTRDKSLGEP